jgi:hypothetical protein
VLEALAAAAEDAITSPEPVELFSLSYLNGVGQEPKSHGFYGGLEHVLGALIMDWLI